MSLLVRKKYPLEAWMGNLPESKKAIPVIHLQIPGSHNTFSYTISTHSDVSPDSPLIVQRLSRYFKIIVNPLIYKWSLTQNLDITSQLKIGIRYLDIRLVNHRGNLIVAHGLLGLAILPLLQLVNSFLTDHTQEVIILDFQHFYEFSQQHHIILVQMIAEIFGSKLCQRNKRICDLTLNDMLSRGEQVIILYRDMDMQAPFLWPSSEWPTPWPNKIKVSELLEYLDSILKHRDTRCGMVTQCILTVDIAYVLRHPFQNLQYLANKVRSKILGWIRAQINTLINVVIVDFVDDDFVKIVLDMNQ